MRLIALDLDGTLLRSDGSISPRNQRVLRQAQARGMHVLTLTARPPRRVQRLADAGALTGLAFCSNGSVLYDCAGRRILREHRLPMHCAHALIAALRASAPGVAFAIEAGAAYGCEPTYRILEEHHHDRSDQHMRRGDALELCRDGVTKLIVQHADYSLEQLLQLTMQHAGALASVTHSGSSFVEVAAAGVTKAYALELFCRERGIDASEVIAFGDMPNDLPMLAWAGRSVAVANAHPSVLAAATEHTCSNDEDGVALVLERLIEQPQSQNTSVRTSMLRRGGASGADVGS